MSGLFFNYEKNMMDNVKIFTDNVDELAKKQIARLGQVPAFTNSKIRIMPDVHAGVGCVIGFTANLGDKVIPNIVGVDIGCGMYTVRLGKKLPDFSELDRIIRERVPSGSDTHENQKVGFPEFDGLKCLDSLHYQERLLKSLGTLGGGNHFIELDVAGDGTAYLVIHTGSRNLGKQVADLYQNEAIERHRASYRTTDTCLKIIEEYRANGRQSEIQTAIARIKREAEELHPDIPPELCYLEGEARERYLHDMRICQHFATVNREIIAREIIEGLHLAPEDAFHTIHNYIDHDSGIVRKGAISARKNERLLIPINMRDGAILGTGKGNDDWNQSAPHGAGRIMSRTVARKTLDIDDFRTSMKGIYSTSISEETLDEAPMVYKGIEEILGLIGDTVDVRDIIRPVYNFKAQESGTPFWKKERK